MNIVALRKSLQNYEERLGKEMIPYLDAHFTLIDELEPELDWMPEDEDAAKAAVREGESILSLGEPELDMAWFAQTAKQFAENALEHLEFSDEIAERIKEIDWSILEDSDNSKVITEPEAALERFLSDLKVDPEDDSAAPIIGALTAAIQTWGYTVGHKVKDFLASFIFSGRAKCPTCGAKPALGIIEEGRRETGSPKFMWCASCDTIWRYPRVQCAHCESSIQQKLHYYFDEDDKAHRVHHCEVCDGLAPVIHEGEMRYIAVPQVEELIMLPLVQAVKERLDNGEDIPL